MPDQIIETYCLYNKSGIVQTFKEYNFQLMPEQLVNVEVETKTETQSESFKRMLEKHLIKYQLLSTTEGS